MSDARPPKPAKASVVGSGTICVITTPNGPFAMVSAGSPRDDGIMPVPESPGKLGSPTSVHNALDPMRFPAVEKVPPAVVSHASTMKVAVSPVTQPAKVISVPSL